MAGLAGGNRWPRSHQSTTDCITNAHHLYERGLQQRYPAVHFVGGVRFVENERVSTAAGLTSGIDLALHVVERYYGRAVAQTTADYMEYHSALWKNPELANVETEAAGK